MTLLIVDGPDGAGKTTLVERLAATLAGRQPDDVIEVLHRKAPAPGVHALDEYVTPLLNYRPGTGRHVICDRWHVGELVYPWVYDRPTTMDRAVWTYVDLFLRSRGALVIYLLPSEDVIERQLARRVAGGGRLGETPPIGPVRRRFELAYERSAIPSYRLTTPVTDDLVIRTLVDLAESTACDATSLAGYVTYVGSPRPTNLLVGDVRNGRHALGSGTAFTPYSATSGHYLFNALAPFGPGLTSYGVINANDVDDVHRFIIDHPTRVVALGNRAHETLHRLGVTHGVVPHSQWWRRFLHGFPGEYAMSIMRALDTGDDLRGEHPLGSWLSSAETRQFVEDVVAG